MLHLVLSTKIRAGQSLATARDRTRRFGELFGLDNLRRTQLVTAVSEIARNATQHGGGGVVNFLAGAATEAPGRQCLVVEIEDKGPGIADLEPVLLGEPKADGSAALGIVAARRLVDRFSMRSFPKAGTSVSMEMLLPATARPFTAELIGELMRELVKSRPQTPFEELEQQNREMLHTLEELRRRQIELEHADRRKNEFLAMLAHELRNPLATISMSVELMRRKKSFSADDVAASRDLIGRQTTQLTRLVNDLLDVSRLTQGKVELKKEPAEFNTLVRHAIEMTRSAIDGKGHALKAVHAPGEAWVMGDVVRLKQVISNVLHNAARYTPEGGEISVTVSRKARSVSVEVADNGIGIDAEMLPRVFDLFTQASSDISRQDSGLGIGLTVVHQLVRDHGGAVTARSEGKDKGSRFTVTLPLSDERGPEAAQDGPRVASLAPSRRVLLIDDNVDSVSAVHELLTLHGYECRVAQALRAQAAEDGALLIALTGYSTEDIRKRAAEAGFERYFVKPLDVDKLLDLLIEADLERPA